MNQYNKPGVFDEIFIRIKKLEIVILGQQINGNMSKPVSPIPPLPGHPRFKNGPFGGMFDMGIDHVAWDDIDESDLKTLEACCCIARAWWLDESKKVFQRQTQTTSPGLLTPEYQKCESNAQAWTDYLKARQAS